MKKNLPLLLGILMILLSALILVLLLPQLFPNDSSGSNPDIMDYQAQITFPERSGVVPEDGAFGRPMFPITALTFNVENIQPDVAINFINVFAHRSNVDLNYFSNVFNGSLSIEPYQTISFVDTFGPFIRENGYVPAGPPYNGQKIQVSEQVMLLPILHV